MHIKVNDKEIEKEGKKMAKKEEQKDIIQATDKTNEVNDKEIEKEAQETAKKVKESKIKIKLPIDPLNPKDLMVPVVINGYQWLIKRGESVEVPEQVAKILEDAKYI